MTAESSSEQPHDATPDRRGAARYLGRAIGTLIVTPPHDRIYRSLKDDNEARGVVVPVHAGIAATIAAVEQVVATAESPGRIRTSTELGRLAALLMQFGNHFTDVPTELQVEYETVDEIYRRVTRQAVVTERRLALDDQLRIGLEVAQGDLSEGLHGLFLASRFYARWLDEATVRGIPALSQMDRLTLMSSWQNALLGFKPGGPDYHDTAGDTYYAWTHAYAGYAFERLQVRPTIATALGRTAFRRGTVIMQTLVNNFNPRGTISDHTIAARYGNAVADACIQGT